MSYCRFSTEDFKSDVYVYSSYEGYVIHIAASYTGGERITFPHAGGSFVESTLHDLRERLLELRNIGYYVPQTALDRIEVEIAEGEE